jgi:UDP-N-acetyl-D-glucosamine dehydrogenase
MSTFDIAVIGAGYVGMPHAQTFAEAGKKVVLVDVLEDVVAAINRGESHIQDVPNEKLKPLVESGAIVATTDFAAVADADAIVIAVGTPLSPQREPDVSYIESAAESIGPHLRKGHLVVLESTTYPGTTRTLQPIPSAKAGQRGGDFHLAYAPERASTPAARTSR